MELKELKNILRKGEGTTIEYKKAQGGVPASIYETVVSFSNTDGGVIVLGADNEGNVLSIDRKNQASYIQEIVSNLHSPDCISPVLYLQPVPVEHEDGMVIVLQVPASSQLHKHGEKIYWRSDDNDQDITGDQQKISNIYFAKREYFSESTIYPYLRFEDLDSNLFLKARSIIASINSTHPWLTMNDKQMLTSASLFRWDFKSGEEGLTLAAALIFGKDETIGHILPAYKVDALVRKVNTDRYDDRLLLRTNLIDTYQQLLSFIKKHLDERFYLEDGQRKDLRELIFREVIGNLIVHREYTNALSSEMILLKDQVLFTNPNKALFHGPLDPEHFNPYPKNPNIRKFFNAFGWTDELGSGVRNTTKYLNIYVPGAKPVFIENDTFTTEIPLLHVSMLNYKSEIVEWFGFDEKIGEYLSENLNNLALPTKLSGAAWEQVILFLVPSWAEKGAKLAPLDWPKKQVVSEEEIKKVPGWAQKGTKLLHKKTSYLIRILLLTLNPITLSDLMKWIEYSKRQTFRENYLIPLQQVSFVTMTRPDEQNAPNQKYVITEKGKQFLTGQEI